MKKIFSVLLPSILAVNLTFAQAPVINGGFESWTGNVPNSWGTSDQVLTGFGQPDPGGVTQDTVNKYSGHSSALLTNKSVTVPLLGTQTVPGVLNYGPIAFDFATRTPSLGGHAYTDRPDTVSFAARFINVTGSHDTGAVIVTLTSWTPNGRVIVANTYVSISDLASFTLFKEKITYHSILTPDTLLIQGLASTTRAATVGTQMWLDTVSFSGLDTAFKAYINPFRSQTGCVGDTIQFMTDPNPNNQFQWYNGASAVSGATHPMFNATTSGSYSVRVTKGGVVYTSDTIAVTINPLPTVNLTLPVTAICVHANAVSLSGGLPPGGRYSGAGVDTTGAFKASTAGTGTHAITYSYTDNNGCKASASQNIVVSLCTGIDIIEPGLKVNIYPNPSDNYMLVETDSKLAGGTIEVFDLLGKPVLKENISNLISQLNVQSLATGNYIVRLSNASKKTVANAQISIAH